jgi:hypothetical protein
VGKSVLVGIVGLLAVIVGVIAAVWIGPDDWVDGPTAVINGGGEVAVATNYGLLSRSFPMRVSASTPDADVFVGIAHVIDADDYLADTTTAQIHWFSPEGLRAEHRDASTATLPALPVGLDFWRTWARGDGVQSVEGDFRGQPVVAVVTTASGAPAPLSVQLSSRFVGTFATAVGLAVLGVVLLLLASWRYWRPRRPEADGGETDVPADAALTPHDPPRGGASFGGLTALVLSVTLCATGCTVPLPFVATDLPPRDQVTRDALDGLDVSAVAADYDRRNNAAIAAAAAPRYSAAEWAAADADLILGGDRFNTAWHRAKKTKTTPSPCRTKLGGGYPIGETSAYPLSILLPEGMSCEPNAEPVLSSITTFTRAHSYEPWRQAASVKPDQPTLPDAGIDPPGTDQVTLAKTASEQVVGFLDGKTVSVAIPASLTKWRMNYLKASPGMTRTWSARVLDRGITVGSADGFSIALVSILVTYRATAKGDRTVHWNHPWDDIRQQKGDYHEVSSHIGVDVLLRLENGQTTLMGWQGRDYLD